MLNLYRSRMTCLPALCATFALLCAAPRAHADLNITLSVRSTPSELYLHGPINNNVNIYCPLQVNSPLIIAPDAKISGNVSIHGKCTVYVQGQVSGTLTTYDTCTASMQGCTLGALQTRDSSSVNLTNTTSASLNIGAMECHNYSQVTGSPLPTILVINPTGGVPVRMPAPITIDHITAYDGADLQLSGCSITHDVNAYDACVDLRNSTIGNLMGSDQSEITLSGVNCKGFVHQVYSSIITINAGTVVQGDVQALGWPYGIDALPGDGLLIHGGTFYGSVSAVGGLIDIDGGQFVKGPLYAMKRPDFNGSHLRSMALYGKNFFISSAGVLTGTLADGTPINVPCSGAVELTSY